MEEWRTPRDTRIENERRKRRSVTRGGAKRLHLLTTIESVRYERATKRAKEGAGA